MRLWGALLEAAIPARRPAGRPRRARHAPARGQAAALRQRPRRRPHPARGRARLGGQARQGRLPRAGRAGRAEGARARAPARRVQASGRRARDRAPRLPVVDCRPAPRRARRRPAWSPAAAPAITVGGAIGLAYVPTALAAAGTRLQIDCRGKDVAATVVSGKFYKRREVRSPSSDVKTSLPDDLRYTNDHEWLRASGPALARRHHPVRRRPARRHHARRPAEGRRPGDEGPALRHDRERQERVSDLYAPSRAASPRSTPGSRTRPSWSTTSRTARAG